MELTRTFDRVRFTVEVIRAAMSALPTPDGFTVQVEVRTTSADTGDWSFDDDEEFFAEYRKNPDRARLTVYSKSNDGYETAGSLGVNAWAGYTSVTVWGSTRADIERVFHVFDAHAAACRLPDPPKPPPPPLPTPVVFIGHGRSTAWRDLKDHLQDQHGLEVVAYETGARAGHTIRDILGEMLTRSTFAILVMTAEDQQADGTVRPRENVVHEAGLFQGRLGYARAIVLVEDEVEPFSNLQGVHYLPFGKDNVRSTFGDVIATIRREFKS